MPLGPGGVLDLDVAGVAGVLLVDGAFDPTGRVAADATGRPSRASFTGVRFKTIRSLHVSGRPAAAPAARAVAGGCFQRAREPATGEAVRSSNWPLPVSAGRLNPVFSCLGGFWVRGGEIARSDD